MYNAWRYDVRIAPLDPALFSPRRRTSTNASHAQACTRNARQRAARHPYRRCQAIAFAQPDFARLCLSLSASSRAAATLSTVAHTSFRGVLYSGRPTLSPLPSPLASIRVWLRYTSRSDLRCIV